MLRALEYWAVRLLLGLLRRLPFDTATAVARYALAILDHAVLKLRRTGRTNLAIAFPGMTGSEQEKVLDGMYVSLARLLAAFARFPDLHRDNISQWIRYDGFEHFECGRRRGKGVLFFTAHLGNWELSAFAHALTAEPMDVLVRPLDNRRIDALAARNRTLSGNRLIGKKEGVRGILRSLKANRAVGILADQNAFESEGVFVDFFGKKASAHAGFARLAAASGAAVIPGFALWSEPERRWVLRFYPAVAMTGDPQQDTQALHSLLETVIREHPDQWLWIHRRWKTRPAGEPPLYGP